MKLFNAKFRYSPRLKQALCRYYSQSVITDSEYTETPQYPPILDTSANAKRLRKRDRVHEKIKNVKTVEEKFLAINMPKYYGFKSVILREDKIAYNAMPLTQHYTRTHFIQTAALPEFYKANDSAASLLAKELQSDIEEALLIEYQTVKRNQTFSEDKPIKQQVENALTKYIVKHINRILINNLAGSCPHLLDAQVDIEPRHEAFWFVGGVDPPTIVKKIREGRDFSKPFANEPIDRPVQYLGTPILTVRSDQPLKPIVPYSDADNPSLSIPLYNYHPQTLGYSHEHRHGTNIPGFWPGDSDEFGIVSIHGRGHILDRKVSFGEEDNLEALHCQALLASFGWLHAQASYQGFTTYNDITYPLVTQTVLTNGQIWSLYAYQLNTLLMHGEFVSENPKKNICYGTAPLKLFEGFDANGKMIGFNDDVLKMVIQFYLNCPEAREGIEMKPFLDGKEKLAADIEDVRKRIWLDDTFKHLNANRPRHLLPYEIYHWEKIYKIDHDTRFREPKRRPFELNENPYKRRLNEHTPKYIPKVLRSFPKCKRKWEPTYYPDVEP